MHQTGYTYEKINLIIGGRGGERYEKYGETKVYFVTSNVDGTRWEKIILHQMTFFDTAFGVLINNFWFLDHIVIYYRERLKSNHKKILKM